jgi:hypothetical protein
LEHDLLGKPEVHPRIKSEGMLFRIMLKRFAGVRLAVILRYTGVGRRGG